MVAGDAATITLTGDTTTMTAGETRTVTVSASDGGGNSIDLSDVAGLTIEVTGGVAALHVIHHLVTGFGVDPTVTRALRSRTFYIVPRVNPDGVEWVLADSPQHRRSSTRAWPWRDAHRAPGLHKRDIDGDGRILTMRVADPNGAWMVSSLDQRLMAPVPLDGTEPGVTR